MAADYPLSRIDCCFRYLREGGNAQLAGILRDGDAFVKRPRSGPLSVALIRLVRPESGSIGMNNKLDYLAKGYVARSSELVVYARFEVADGTVDTYPAGRGCGHLELDSLVTSDVAQALIHVVVSLIT